MLKKNLKCVWYGLDAYFVCRVFLGSNKKPITFHLNTIQVNGIGKQLFFKWHDENHFGLGKKQPIQSPETTQTSMERNNSERNS